SSTTRSLVDGDRVVDDVGWCYPDPPPESLPIKGFLSFDETRVELLAELPVSARS
ncbi:DUF427 domain-containing protein, partial [Mycobacterium avium]|uniref:DUF427 domain-containing protein n=1 Tax=Mycobacterium avium TaxID=1764 RepID=UPI00111BEF93